MIFLNKQFDTLNKKLIENNCVLKGASKYLLNYNKTHPTYLHIQREYYINNFISLSQFFGKHVIKKTLSKIEKSIKSYEKEKKL